MTKQYQKLTNEIKLKDGYYHPKYSNKRLAISEEDFIEKVNQSQLRLKNTFDEHSLIKQFQPRAEGTFEIVAENMLSNRQYREIENLLFYHWYERRFNKNIITNDLLYTLNISSITSLYNRFTKEDVSLNIFNQIENHFKSERFSGFSIYYEFFYDFFPSIEKFTFNEFLQKEFLFYLLELFPKIVGINYKNKMNLWRITESELRDSGDDDFHMSTMVRNHTHNAIIYNKHHLPSFYPSKLGENNYEYYNIGLPDIYTPLFKIEKYKMRTIENEIRQQRELPRIGEGWISETLLYYKIKKALPDYHIVQHGQPKWLGMQHLDIYLPEFNIAIEYQGIQHQKPIDYFGGETAFNKNQERDARKKRLCEENDCLLLYVYPNDDVDKFIEELKHIL